MRSRLLSFGLVALVGLGLSSPTLAADFDKYLPDGSALYVQIHLPHLFKSELVRKAVPMAFDKYGDQIAGLAGMAKGLPNMPDIPEDQLKEMLKQLAKPENIANGFDQAKNFISDIVVAGDPQNDKQGKSVVVVIKSALINAQMVEMVANMAKAAPQVEIEAKKKGNNTVYSLKPPQQDQSIFATVPENGILLITANEKNVDTALGRADGKTKPKFAEGLADLVAKRNANDFVFMAGCPSGKDELKMQTMYANLVLDKDLSGKMVANFENEELAKAGAKKMTDGLAKMLDGLKDVLGDKAGDLKPHLEKAKAIAKDKSVEASFTIPGTAVEKLLAK